MADNTGIHPLRSLKSGVSLILAGVVLAAVCFGAGFFTGGHHPVRLHQHGPV